MCTCIFSTRLPWLHSTVHVHVFHFHHPAGVPDTPVPSIENSEVSWLAVDSRSDGPVTSYFLEAIQIEVVGGITIMPSGTRSEFTYNLLEIENELNLQIDQTYNICVTAMNKIGNSSSGCGVYTHEGMSVDGMYVCMHMLSIMIPLHT